MTIEEIIEELRLGTKTTFEQVGSFATVLILYGAAESIPAQLAILGHAQPVSVLVSSAPSYVYTRDEPQKCFVLKPSGYEVGDKKTARVIETIPKKEIPCDSAYKRWIASVNARVKLNRFEEGEFAELFAQGSIKPYFTTAIEGVKSRVGCDISFTERAYWQDYFKDETLSSRKIDEERAKRLSRTVLEYTKDARRENARIALIATSDIVRKDSGLRVLLDEKMLGYCVFRFT